MRDPHELLEQDICGPVVSLLNEERPPIWEQVSDWIDRNGAIANSDLCGIARVDTLKASKMFKRWVDQGLLVPDASRAKRNMVYNKPVTTGDEEADLLSGRPDNNVEI